MPRSIHFIDWNRPVTDKICHFLLHAEPGSGPIDLEDTLIVVPTRQAGRRLRQALARRCAESGRSLLSAQTVTPKHFLQSKTEQPTEASALLIESTWAHILMKIDLADHRGFFPAQQFRRDFSWAMHTGRIIQELRRTLSDSGYTIANIPDLAGDDLAEPERWLDLQLLEQAYLAHLTKLGAHDPCIEQVQLASAPSIPDNIKRIVVAAVPSPTPLSINALMVLSENCQLDLLVHAPHSLKELFDEWGRPIADKWHAQHVPIPDFEKNVFLAASPSAQSRIVIDLIAENADRFGPADIAIGVPDRAVVPFLEADLAAHGLPAFDPAEQMASDHAVYRLLDALLSLFIDRSYESLSTVMRHPDLLAYFKNKMNISSFDLLSELDEFQNKYVPLEFSDVLEKIPETEHTGENTPVLPAPIRFLRDQLAAIERHGLVDTIRSFIEELFRDRKVTGGNSIDEELRGIAKAVQTVLKEFDNDAIRELEIDPSDAASLFLGRLAQEQYDRQRDATRLDLEGWIELSWNDAPFMVVTGMNEGSVPDTRLTDVFVPDSIRSKLGLPDDAQRLARDAFLLRALIESRREHGMTCLVSGKTSAAGDPLKPSRLLFRCKEEQLPARVTKLFGDAQDLNENFPSSISFKLDPRPPCDLDDEDLIPSSLSVTAFRDYLACPFRFYLSRILGMGELDDTKRGMDALDFGNMIHSALERLADDKIIAKCSDENMLATFLKRKAELWAARRFGKNPPLSVTMLLDSAKQRLSAAARIQARLLEEGWETIVRPESSYQVKDFGGMALRGKIDRIDRNRNTGTVRIIDYKTSDSGNSPSFSHIASARDDTTDIARFKTIIKGKQKEMQWIDLQLPLYLVLLENEDFMTDNVELAYFNMPKAASDTGIAVWEGFTEELLSSARACALEVAGAIRANKFWPPSNNVRYDDFKSLHNGDVSDSILPLKPSHFEERA